MESAAFVAHGGRRRTDARALRRARRGAASRTARRPRPAAHAAGVARTADRQATRDAVQPCSVAARRSATGDPADGHAGSLVPADPRAHRRARRRRRTLEIAFERGAPVGGQRRAPAARRDARQPRHHRRRARRRPLRRHGRGRIPPPRRAARHRRRGAGARVALGLALRRARAPAVARRAVDVKQQLAVRVPRLVRRGEWFSPTRAPSRPSSAHAAVVAHRPASAVELFKGQRRSAVVKPDASTASVSDFLDFESSS